jgi:hypothetical protein
VTTVPSKSALTLTIAPSDRLPRREATDYHGRMRLQVATVSFGLLLADITANADSGKPALTATCPGLQGLAITSETGTSSSWQLTPDGYQRDTYVVRVFDRKRAEVEIRSAGDPRIYTVTIVDVQPQFFTMVGLEVQRPVLITLYTNGVLSYAQHRWNKVTDRAETKAFNSACKVEGGLPTK